MIVKSKNIDQLLFKLYLKRYVSIFISFFVIVLYVEVAIVVWYVEGYFDLSWENVFYGWNAMSASENFVDVVRAFFIAGCFVFLVIYFFSKQDVVVGVAINKAKTKVKIGYKSLFAKKVSVNEIAVNDFQIQLVEKRIQGEWKIYEVILHDCWNHFATLYPHREIWGDEEFATLVDVLDDIGLRLE